MSMMRTYSNNKFAVEPGRKRWRAGLTLDTWAQGDPKMEQKKLIVSTLTLIQ